jgi:hypothetical protein
MKKLKDDTWKSHDRDPKKREAYVDTGDRYYYQRSKCNDKESDDSVQGQEDGTIKGR